MASIVPGYSYDIFISYRQKDNKGDRWVSKFVEALKTELESTFKEDISVYFDINPHDGLLETHQVEASLNEKLKCLVFIPVISQTYCDPKSFAWKYEFCAFNKLAKEDAIGRDIKLTSGNVASRILPVKIHDLNSEDTTLLESELGGVLRAIEFIYKEPGVNRPLKPTDNKSDNLNKTDYKNQVNKVANAVKELITGLKNPDPEKKDLYTKKNIYKNGSEAIRTNSHKIKIAVFTLIIIGLIVPGFFIIPPLFKKSSEVAEKSIAVLPFHNMSNDPEQEYFSDGMMQEILNHLFMIGGLKIPSGTSSMRFKESNLSVSEIAQELGVAYLLEGNVSRSGNHVRIIVRIINGKDERVMWTEDYVRAITATDLLEIQSDIAQHVAENMRVVIDPEVKKRIEAKPTVNTEAYTLFLQAWTNFLSFDQAKTKLERAIYLDPGYADAYAQLAYYWLHQGGYGGDLVREQVLLKAEPLLDKALQLDNNSLVAHTTMAILKLYYYWDFASVEKEIKIFKQLNPSNSDLEYFVTDYLLASGKFHEAFIFTENALKQNKKEDNWIQMALTYNYNRQPDKALETIQTAYKLFPDNGWVLINFVKILVYQGKYDKAISLFETSFPHETTNNMIPLWLGYMGISYYKIGDKNKSAIFLEELLSRSRNSAGGSPSFCTAAIYTAEGDTDKAIQFLEKAYASHEVEMYWLKVEPLFEPLRGDLRYQAMLDKVGFPK